MPEIDFKMEIRNSDFDKSHSTWSIKRWSIKLKGYIIIAETSSFESSCLSFDLGINFNKGSDNSCLFYIYRN
jgi:hypothetical protein